jgi:translation initiation factor 1
MGDLNFNSNGFGDIYDIPIHIRKTQRNARKCHTTIEGLPEDLDLQKIGKHFAKKNQCSYTIVSSPKYGQVIQLTGDKKEFVKKFLIDEQICKEDQIHLHG